MAVRKLSISMPEDIAEQAQESARLTGMTLSAWMTEAAFSQLGVHARLEIGRRAAQELIEEVAAESGPITAEEQAWADNAFATLFPGRSESSGDKAAG